MAKVITKQGIFNHVYRFLTKQGRAAQLKNDHAVRCVYRRQDGDQTLCCAAGCLLSDKEAEGLDSQPMGSYLALVRANKTPERFDAHAVFISELQRIHDGHLTRSLAKWQNEMQSFAALHGLIVPEVHNGKGD